MIQWILEAQADLRVPYMQSATEIVRYDEQLPDPADEDFHPAGDDPTWSESYYFYYFDPEHGLGGYTRLGFRPHDGWRDAVHMLYGNGAEVDFGYVREAHRAGDRDVAVGTTRLAMGEPFGLWRIDFEGETEHFADGRSLVTPRKERPVGSSRPEPARLALDYEGIGVPFYAERAGGGGHFEQFARARGEFQIGGRSVAFDGFGLRDKSWGPRPWTNQTGASARDEAPGSPFGQGEGWRVYGSWFTGVFHSGLAFAVGASPTAAPGMSAQGHLMKDGRNHPLTSLGLEVDYAGDTLFQARCRIEAGFEDGTELELLGEVLNNGPSKIPHSVGATIVNAAMTRFTLASGESGLGMTEFHSSVVRPGSR